MLSDAQWVALSARIAAFSGLALDASRRRQVETALTERIAATAQGDLGAYLRALHDSELQALSERLLNHETQFFRTPAHFAALATTVLPQRHAQCPAPQPLRLWSAGCATGEEAYTLALTALQTLPSTRTWTVYATDLSHDALRRAHEAWYRSRSLANIAPADLVRWFVPERDGFRLRPEFRSSVCWEQHNLLAAFPTWAHDLDVIFCENVTIYFALPTCRALMERLWAALAPGGYLFVGYSETLWRIFDGFELVELAGAFAYRKPFGERAVRPPPTHSVFAPPASVRAWAARPEPPAPPTALALLKRGRLLVTRGAWEEALDSLRQIPPDHRVYPAALATTAHIHANRGEWALAAAEAHRAIALDILTGEAHVLLGTIYAQQRNWDKAAEHLSHAQYLDPAAPLPSFHLATVYRSQGRTALAARTYRATLHKLLPLPASALLEGVSVHWLRESCQRSLSLLHDQ